MLSNCPQRSAASCVTSTNTKVTKVRRKGGDTRPRGVYSLTITRALYTKRAVLLLQLAGSSVPYDFTTPTVTLPFAFHSETIFICLIDRLLKTRRRLFSINNVFNLKLDQVSTFIARLNRLRGT